MAKITKKQKEALSKVDKNKIYNIEEASSLVKEINTTKFDASVDIAVRLGVDQEKQTKWCVAWFHYLTELGKT
jgi:large subunit ribosomal protein L1